MTEIAKYVSENDCGEVKIFVFNEQTTSCPREFAIARLVKLSEFESKRRGADYTEVAIRIRAQDWPALRAVIDEMLGKCPIGLDATPDICSAGTCPACVKARDKHAPLYRAMSKTPR